MIQIILNYDIRSCFYVTVWHDVISFEYNFDDDVFIKSWRWEQWVVDGLHKNKLYKVIEVKNTTNINYCMFDENSFRI